MPRSPASGAEKDITIIDVVAFEDILPDLFFFNGILKDINSVNRAVFQGYIEPVKNGAVVGAGFVIDFFGFFGEDFADQFVDFS